MKTRTKIILACIASSVVLAVFSFCILEMGSDSMEPVIQGSGSPPSRNGDRLLVLNRPFYSEILVGHYVVVTLPSPYLVDTVRRVVAVTVKDNKEEIILASEKLNGIDSRHFGAVGIENIRGRVIKILK